MLSTLVEIGFHYQILSLEGFMSTSYKIIFNGDISPHSTLEEAKQNVAKLFKTSVENIANLFSGKRVIIKDHLDKETAVKYHAALFRSGASCEMQENEPNEEAIVTEKEPTVKPVVVTKPEQTVPEADDKTTDQTETAQTKEEINIKDESMIAPPGVVIVEPITVEPALIDTSMFSLAEAGETLIKAQSVPEPEINIDSLEIVPVESNLKN